MGNVQLEADQIRYKDSSGTYRNVQTGLTAAIAGGGGGGSSTLAGLTDTDITTPSNGQVLTYDSTATKWENAPIPAQSIEGLSDTTITTPTNGQVLTYDSTSEKWVNASSGGGGGDYTFGQDTFTSASSATAYADAKTLEFTGGGVYHIIASAHGDGTSAVTASSVQLVDSSGALYTTAVSISANAAGNPTVNALIDFGSSNGTVKIQVKGTVSSTMTVNYMYKKVADAPTNNSR